MLILRDVIFQYTPSFSANNIVPPNLWYTPNYSEVIFPDLTSYPFMTSSIIAPNFPHSQRSTESVLFTLLLPDALKSLPKGIPKNIYLCTQETLIPTRLLYVSGCESLCASVRKRPGVRIPTQLLCCEFWFSHEFVVALSVTRSSQDT